MRENTFFKKLFLWLSLIENQTLKKKFQTIYPVYQYVLSTNNVILNRRKKREREKMKIFLCRILFSKFKYVIKLTILPYFPTGIQFLPQALSKEKTFGMKIKIFSLKCLLNPLQCGKPCYCNYVMLCYIKLVIMLISYFVLKKIANFLVQSTKFFR